VSGIKLHGQAVGAAYDRGATERRAHIGPRPGAARRKAPIKRQRLYSAFFLGEIKEKKPVELNGLQIS